MNNYTKYSPLWFGISSDVAQWMVFLAPSDEDIPNNPTNGFRSSNSIFVNIDWLSRNLSISVFTTPGCKATAVTPVSI